jgi:hypothetical protein
MNLQSEISFFSEMATSDKARLMASFLAELTSEARATYGATQESVHDGALRHHGVHEFLTGAAAPRTACSQV